MLGLNLRYNEICGFIQKINPTLSGCITHIETTWDLYLSSIKKSKTQIESKNRSYMKGPSCNTVIRY